MVRVGLAHQEDLKDYYQEVCLQIWRSKDKFRGDSKWSTWVYRLSLNICLTLKNILESNKFII
ncbi:sigma factor [Flavivirga algicola]|uniref:sigma factor n=1 Tax=Flavivirga algicola TaxID=2729136 RepID=UPI001F0F97C7|nr:sigma factor [Flavivirga algicola]